MRELTCHRVRVHTASTGRISHAVLRSGDAIRVTLPTGVDVEMVEFGEEGDGGTWCVWGHGGNRATRGDSGVQG